MVIIIHKVLWLNEFLEQAKISTIKASSFYLVSAAFSHVIGLRLKLASRQQEFSFIE